MNLIHKVFLSAILSPCLLSVATQPASAATGSGSEVAASAGEKMNVLFIISDDLRNEMGCYGSTLAQTPYLDALAAKGVRFDRAYCQFPLCNPSRSSLLTGLKPTSVGVLGNRDWLKTKKPDLVTLPMAFKQQGYATLRAGKIFHSGLDDKDAWTEGGKERYFGPGATAEVPRRHRDVLRADRPGGPKLTKSQRSDRWLVLDGEGEKHGDYRVTDRAIEYLKESKDQPFFLALGLTKPHSPLEAPQRFYDQFDLDQITLPPDFAPRPTVPEGFPAGSIRPRNADLFVGRDASPTEAKEMIRAYLASSAWMDWNAGRMLQALEESGLAEKTIIVFWGDHGYQLGEKGKWSKAGSLWEQGARVPFFIYDPRSSGNGQACSRVVEMIDLYPTLIDLCGLEPPAGLEGRSLAPLLDDPQQPWNHPAYTVWSEDGEHVTGVSVRTENWHFAEFYGRGAGAMLIDPAKDPHEMTNLAHQPQYSEVVDELSQLAREYSAGHRPPRARTVRWRGVMDQAPNWYGSDAAVRIADNVLLYQHPNGGWGKNIDMAQDLSAEQKKELLARRESIETLIDNGATYTQIEYLARVHRKTQKPAYAEAALRGIEYLLDAQYDNGGWPMIYPLQRGYYSHITFNDGSMIGVMHLLRRVSMGEAPYDFVAPDIRARAARAIEKGVDAILKCQVKVDGKRTVWCAQHDEHTFAPAKARSYELPSLSGQESVGIVRYLMSLEHPTPEIRAAIEGAVDWFRAAKISGIAVKYVRDQSLPRGYDKQVIEDPNANPLWARFYEIGTNKPMFVGRDGIVKASLDQIEHERRVGYRWLTPMPNELLEKDYPAWLAKHTADASGDADAHYAFSYFVGNGEDGLHLLDSTDGYRWKKIAGGRSLLTPKVGHDKLMRDPAVCQGPDGTFHMVWTVSWGERGIGYSSSEDLVHWAPQRYLPVMEHEPTARNCWAPEAFYDSATDQFVIYWATTIPGKFPETDGQIKRDDADPGYDHRMYYTTTSDFQEFAPTKLLYDPGFNVIDATLLSVKGRYAMILKNETDRPFKAEKNLRVAWSDRAVGPYGPPGEPITGDYWAEGPTAIQISETWHVYFDKYRDHRYGMVTSEDLLDWKDESAALKMPAGVRHGTAFPISAELAEELLALP